MYRLLKVSNLSFGNVNSLILKPATCVAQTSYLCSFCKFYHHQPRNSPTYQQLKQYSTTAKPSEISTPIGKKPKRKNTKYVDIVEVTNVATNKRAKVKALNAKNLARFVKENNTREQLIKEIRIILHEKNMGIEENTENSEKPGVKKVIDSDKIAISYDLNSTQDTEKIKKQQSKTEISATTSELIIETRQENLFSFFQACINSGNLKQSFDCFVFVSKNGSCYVKPNFQSVKLYNLFLRQFAIKGDLKHVKLIVNLIKESSLKMTHESYASIFECVARSQNPSSEIEFLTTVRKQMEDEKTSLNDIVVRPTFLRGQLEKVIEGVRLLEENFTPYFYPPRVSYNCNLLRGIYKNRTPESPAKGLLQLSDLRERARKQLEIEKVGHVSIENISVKGKPSPQVLNAREKVRELDEIWKAEIRKGFQRSIASLKARERGIQITYLHPYLTVLEPEDYVDAILKEAKILSESMDTFSPPVYSLSRELAINLFKKYESKVQRINGLEDTILECYDNYCKWYLEGGYQENGRRKWQNLEQEWKEKGKCLDIRLPQWSFNVMTDVGKFLYDIILKDVKINVGSKKDKEILVPAFYITFRSKYKQMKEEIKPHPILAKLYQDCQPETLTFNSNLLPSLAPPKPWTSSDKGGYLVNKSTLIRIPFGVTDQWKKVKRKPKEQLYPSLDCLNQLGSIPWCVNHSILDVAIKVFQSGGSVELNVPESPSILPQAPLITEEMTHDERSEINKTRGLLKRRKNEMYSLWCDALYKLSLANHYKDEIFWLPHNMDFRGRVYPIPPHLSQMGSDFARSLLIFAQKKPLGPKGLNWLKIHTINLTGFKKKESIQTRLAFADEILDEILDSAENPLTGKKWWTTSDEPWQTLAACMEISKALKSPDPSKYVTGFPVHQDGSCNGLQHYAALGRDQIGAESVNLCPFEKPRDVYSDVVVLVEEARKADAESGLEIAQVLEGYIERKVIKQTIMTTVYGVTKYGARLQISKQLKDVKDFPEDKIWASSSYLVEKTFHSLRTMFTSAKEIQDWFTECAKLICLSRELPVEWETALGLPIVQPYFKSNTIERKKPNVAKQRNAFPPNFVHSLDSTHMMMTSLFCEQAGITFMSVHDCFWTHPCTVSKMNEICRKQFISLHSEPILENLSQFLLNNYKFSQEELGYNRDEKVAELRENLNSVLHQVPSKGNFDLKQVEFSTYFFS